MAKKLDYKLNRKISMERKGKSKHGVLKKIINSSNFTKNIRNDGPTLPLKWLTEIKTSVYIGIEDCLNLVPIGKYGPPKRTKLLKKL